MLLDRRQFFVKEKVAFVKLTDTYDLIDPESGQVIGVAREEPAAWSKYARLLVKKHFLPTIVNVYEGEEPSPLFTLSKSMGLLGHTVAVTNAQGETLGRFKSKSFTLGCSFNVFDSGGEKVAEVKGDWKGWNFRLLDAAGVELGIVTKKWAGLGKEFFTSSDNYVISFSDEAPSGHALARSCSSCRGRPRPSDIGRAQGPSAERRRAGGVNSRR